MISFIDGPAKGVVLTLFRTPILLRVVCDAAGKWDALDQLDDQAQPGEQIFVYIMQGNAGWVHIDYTDKSGRRRGRTEPTADYAIFPETLSDEQVRSNEKWVAWCEANRERILASRKASA